MILRTEAPWELRPGADEGETSGDGKAGAGFSWGVLSAGMASGGSRLHGGSRPAA